MSTHSLIEHLPVQTVVGASSFFRISVVLEATGRVGGRTLTVLSGDVIREEDSRQWVDCDAEDHLYVNLGPARQPFHHRTILGYCREFGVDLEVFTNDNRAGFFHNRDRFDAPVLARQVMTDTRGYIAELLAKAVNRDAQDSELTGEDKELILDLLRSHDDLDPDDLLSGIRSPGCATRKWRRPIACRRPPRAISSTLAKPQSWNRA